ncbi:NAD-dependent epimerase/dehydratase family protein [Algibacillus agarilyticus]|uniref:NAD-dependent epimerase/dehydratase family protein n=1 Tax=Algibacillus agarilyticus TaxID=2234133 RepID=UPI000DCFDA16|nr:NAD-dependent epimerase/dehydratase family protein [Algibacillus agarilyticus]
MAKYLVTGGCGYIGLNLVKHLLILGHEVSVLDDLSSGRHKHLPASCKFILADAAELKSVSDAMLGIDGCFHLAAKPLSTHNKHHITQINLHNLSAAMTVFNAASEQNVPVVYASSSEVYGHNADYPFTEKSITQPISELGATMLSIENFARIATLRHKTSIVGLRLFEVYGQQTMQNALISQIVSQLNKPIYENDKILIKSCADSVHDFVHINDVVLGFVSAMKNRGVFPYVINLCSGQPITTSQLVKSIFNVLSIKNGVDLHNIENKAQYLSVGDNGLSRQLLNFKPSITLLEGLFTIFSTLSPMNNNLKKLSYIQSS